MCNFVPLRNCLKPLKPFLQALFGVAYTLDVDELSEKLKNVESHLENDVRVVKDSQSNLMTETKTVLEEQKSKMTKVEDMTHDLELKVRRLKYKTALMLGKPEC